MRSAAIRLDASERWRGPGSSIGRASRTMALIALASLAGHLLVVGTAVVSGRASPAPPPEISVEVVQEVPKPVPEQPKAAEPAKRTRAEPPEEAAKPALEPPEPKTEPAKPQPPVRTAAKPPPRPRVDAEEQKLAALQNELESLQAEQASLQAERAAAETARAEAQAPAAPRDTGLGPLPDSFQAVALPAAADGQGEAVSYQEIVFSALAKAKGFGRTKGLPGSAGVRFSVDATGRLVDLELVHKSGVPSLDAQALDIVRRAAPFPPPPQGAQRSFSANVNFVTEGAQ